MPKFMCKKLVRDKTLERMKRFEISVNHRTLNKKELLSALKDKLVEEAAEVGQTKDRQELIKELADVLEVIDGIKKAYELSDQEVADAKEQSLRTRGGFYEGIFIEHIELAEDNEWTAYFRANGDRYTEQ